MNTKQFMHYINNSPMAFQAVENAMDLLMQKGFTPIREDQKWNLQRGKNYLVTRGQTALAAFTVPAEAPLEKGFSLWGAHTDSPAFRIKPDSIKDEKGILKATSDLYGAPIVSTWINRDLGIAGSLVYLENGRIVRKPFTWSEPVAQIINPPIHFDRNINSGKEYNKQTQLQVTFGNGTKEEFWQTLKQKAGLTNGIQLEGADLYLYSLEDCRKTGLKGEEITGPRLDNLAMCYLGVHGLTTAEATESFPVIFLYDHEEIGSTSSRGAGSGFTMEILERINLALGGNREAFLIQKAKSFLISADGVHGFSPNYGSDFDPDYAPLLGKGPSIKINFNQKYATTDQSAAYFKQLCSKAGIQPQTFIMKSDKPCGSTIGSITSTITGIETIDAGLPLLSMHSIRETIHTRDIDDLEKVLKLFWK